MSKEIEYKFLVTDLSAVAELTPLRYDTITQAYLTDHKNRACIRVRTSKLSSGDVESYITVKGPAQGMTRDEYEYLIPNEDAAAMVGLAQGKIISKTRYFFEHGSNVIELDIFEDDLAGLVIAEIEVESED